jgi:hypothetical protein
MFVVQQLCQVTYSYCIKKEFIVDSLNLFGGTSLQILLKDNQEIELALKFCHLP